MKWVSDDGGSTWRDETIIYSPQDPNRWPKVKGFGRKATNARRARQKRLQGKWREG